MSEDGMDIQDAVRLLREALDDCAEFAGEDWIRDAKAFLAEHEKPAEQEGV